MFILILIGLLILLNGYFSAAEIAIVSVEKFKIQEEADKGNKSAKTILEYLKEPSGYLSTIQVGLTLIGLIEGFYGGEVFETFLEPKFVAWGMSAGWAHVLGIAIGVGLITYITIVIGELLPKSLAIRSPQKIALQIVPSFRFFTFISYPFVQILTVSTRFLLRIIHANKPENQKLTDEDLKSLLSQAYRQGTLEKEELKLHENIFDFYEQVVESIMTPLKEVVAIPLEGAADQTDQIMRQSPHNYFPVVQGQNVLVGYICARDYFRDGGKNIREQTRAACTLKKNQKASELLKKFKEKNQNFGIVVNDKGELYGLVTMHDIGESLIGNIP
ncbi:MAG TPA: hemolysin family protein [Puia sp.]